MFFFLCFSLSPGAGGTVAAEGATYSNPARIPYKFSMTANVRGYHKILSVTSVYEKLKMEIKDDESAEVSIVTTLLCFRKDVFYDSACVRDSLGFS